MSPLRRSLARPWIYAGVGLALAMVLPNILWQQHQGWPGSISIHGKLLKPGSSKSSD